MRIALAILLLTLTGCSAGFVQRESSIIGVNGQTIATDKASAVIWQFGTQHVIGSPDIQLGKGVEVKAAGVGAQADPSIVALIGGVVSGLLKFLGI